MKNRIELCGILSENFPKVAANKKFRSNLLQYCAKQYAYNAADLIQNAALINTLNDCRLYWVSDSIVHSGIEISFAPEDFFTLEEIERYESEKEVESVKTKRGDILSFPVFEVDNGKQWIGVLSIKQLRELSEGNFYNYNMETQRETKMKSFGGVWIQVATVFRNKIKEIEKLILSNEYISDELSFNIVSADKKNPPAYEYSEGELLLDNVSFDVIDGFHRLSAIISASHDGNVDEEKRFPINFFAFTDDEARTYIAQKNKQTKISERRASSFDATREELRALGRLKRYPIEYSGPAINREDCPFSFETFASLIMRFLPYNKKEDARDYERSLAEKLDILYTSGLIDFKKNGDRFYSDTELTIAIAMISENKSPEEIKEKIAELDAKKVKIGSYSTLKSLKKEGVITNEKR